ncbi:MAG: hypothetical protein PHE06_02320 [Lachnospiraceae bacterium]|nr:hypothetical protein [Lachnospiraceae bacterium]
MERAEARPANRSNKKFHTYVDGNTVRKIQPMPNYAEPKKASTSSATRKNREKALQMNLGYVVFLTAAAVITVMVCINYLKLQSQSTASQKTVTVLETQLSDLKLDNDSEYNRIISSVNLEQVKDVAMNELGMVYAAQSQIRTFGGAESDYVKQYQAIPAE